ncbi:hypothetical protein [Faecalibacillus intestinalis]|jgi:hypothetical protein|uniref:hypothetical protein n=1 Tax=Faecalibacillus intestinalis TaxID=1982626 RepID=UPI0022DF96C2|nr:hypothetical protein [Faecalibacillus intestinalis]
MNIFKTKQGIKLGNLLESFLSKKVKERKQFMRVYNLNNLGGGEWHKDETIDVQVNKLLEEYLDKNIEIKKIAISNAQQKAIVVFEMDK